MFRYEDGADITDEEFNLYVEPFSNKCHEYLESEILPKYIAFYLATGVDMKALWQASFKIHIQSAAGMFNMNYKNYESLRVKIIDILYNRYKLRVISEDPLNFEEVS
ncbi:MAG: hypothetical protein IJ475_01540 [Bacilli bacterium]|nr:hypothetical protein [Bacilli bacterium]